MPTIPAMKRSPKRRRATKNAAAQPAAHSKLSGYEKLKARGAKVIAVKISEGYLDIFKSEAELFRTTRGRFLEMLLQRKRGELPFERPKNAPEYQLSEKQLIKGKLWTWYVMPDFKELLDEDRLLMGNMAVGAWIIVTLNQWLGHPGGLHIKS